MKSIKGFITIVLLIIVLGLTQKTVLAQVSPSVLYVPLIGLTEVPDPLSLPNGEGDVTYHYAVKNFLAEVPLFDIQVSDDKCSPIKFVEGDDNKNSLLDSDETWRYTCTVKISSTTQSISTVKGTANSVTASHKAYATVIVGSKDPAPLVSVVNITKVAYPLSLPSEGGPITFTYKVNNPGVIPLSDVTVTDDKCHNLSSRLGDTNGNNLLDIHEVWIYTCNTTLTQTTTNTVHVSAFANNLEAVDDATITVKVAGSSLQSNLVPGFSAQEIPSFPNAGANPNMNLTIWLTLSGILIILILILFLARKNKSNRFSKKGKIYGKK